MNVDGLDTTSMNLSVMSVDVRSRSFGSQASILVARSADNNMQVTVAVLKQRCECVARHRLAHQVSLQLIALHLPQGVVLSDRLDAFCHGVHLECTGETNNRLYQRLARVVVGQPR